MEPCPRIKEGFFNMLEDIVGYLPFLHKGAKIYYFDAEYNMCT